MALGVALALLLCAAFAADQRIVTSNGNTFDFVGWSGQIKITPSATKNAAKWIKSSWDKIYEVDANGNEIPSTGVQLASTDFIWTEPVTTVFPLTGDLADMTTLAATLRNGALFNVTCWVFNQTTYIINGENTQTISVSAVKYSISLQNWPWSTNAVSLTFGARVQSKGGRNMLDVHANQTAEQYLVTYGIGGIQSLMTAYYDGVEGPVTVSASESNAAVEIKWIFDKFQNTLVYDPVLWSSGSRAIASLTTILMLSLALLSLL
jgi:hypothetical protein